MPTQKIRVLSVRQPYADEIIYGDKWNELRSWKTPYRGPVYIHASRWDGSPAQGSPGPGTTGAIIGRVELVDCLPEEDLAAVLLNSGKRRHKLPTRLRRVADALQRADVTWEHGIGEWNWIMLDPTPLLRPITVLGKLNLWHAEFPEKQLDCGEPTPGCRRPSASDWPDPDAPLEEEPVPVSRPDGWVANLLFDHLKAAGSQGCQMTRQNLARLARTWEREVEHLERILASCLQFERVPGKPERGRWWRLRQVTMVDPDARPRRPRP